MQEYTALRPAHPSSEEDLAAAGTTDEHDVQQVVYADQSNIGESSIVPHSACTTAPPTGAIVQGAAKNGPTCRVSTNGTPDPSVLDSTEAPTKARNSNDCASVLDCMYILFKG